MTIDIDKKVIEDSKRIEDLETEYLKEITSLSKIFITLSIAILGLSMSQSSLDFSKKVGLVWIMSTWICLILSAILGFIGIFFFSRRIKKKADYIQNSMIVDIVMSQQKLIANFENKLDEFLGKSEADKKKFDRQYRLCVVSVSFQALLLLFAFILFGIFRGN